MLNFTTKEQLTAQEAYSRVSERSKDKDFDDYKSFALSFPSLIHSCGLVQALAFAQAKDKGEYIDDLQKVFDTTDDAGNLPEKSRKAHVMEYMRMTRHAISAASWIKRYCQASENEGGNNIAELP